MFQPWMMMMMMMMMMPLIEGFNAPGRIRGLKGVQGPRTCHATPNPHNCVIASTTSIAIQLLILSLSDEISPCGFLLRSYDMQMHPLWQTTQKPEISATEKMNRRIRVIDGVFHLACHRHLLVILVLPVLFPKITSTDCRSASSQSTGYPSVPSRGHHIRTSPALASV